jgi:probable F420-dependent oxidoreductase
VEPLKIGYMPDNNAQGIRPDRLSAELEQRGFESVWFPEHSHIPTSRASPYPGGGPLPEAYRHVMSPFVSLALAASATTSLRLCTGVCLLLEHDLLDLACTTATLDVLSQGRLFLGIGVGWNEEELRNHRPDIPFAMRFSAMRERVAALRVAWTEEAPSFAGRWDQFEESWVYPKPVRGTVPVGLGNSGRVGIEHAAAYADEWCPVDSVMVNSDGRHDVAGVLETFRTKVADNGRDPDAIPTTIFAMDGYSMKRLSAYAELGFSRVVLPPLPTTTLHTADATLRHLDELDSIVKEFA